MWKGNWRSGWKEKKHKLVLNWSNRLPPLLYFTNDFGICSSLNLTCQVVWSSGSIIFCQVDTYAWVLLESAKVTKIGQQECWCLQMTIWALDQGRAFLDHWISCRWLKHAVARCRISGGEWKLRLCGNAPRKFHGSQLISPPPWKTKWTSFSIAPADHLSDVGEQVRGAKSWASLCTLLKLNNSN